MTRSGGPSLAVLSATQMEIGFPTLASPQDADKHAWPVVAVRDLAGVPVLLAVSGMGKANAAAAVASLGRGHGVSAVVQVGIGGAYPGANVGLGAAALAGTELDLDLGLGRHPEWSDVATLSVPGETTRNVIDLSGRVLEAAAGAAALGPLPFATSDSVTADAEHAAYLRRRFDVAIESMEGAGAARAALAVGVAFLEIRGVSNVVGDRDRSAWLMKDALAAAWAAAGSVVPAVMEVV